MRFILTAVACLLLTNAVAQKKKGVAKDTVQHILLDTLDIVAPPGPPPYQPSFTRSWEITHTRLAISFNFAARTANGREWVTMHPWCYPQDSIVLDAKGMKVDTVQLRTIKKNLPLRFKYTNNKLHIYFDKTYLPSDTLQLYLCYTASPYAEQTGGSAAITDDRGLYFINTEGKIPYKPLQVWTQGETESNSHWLITIDKPNTRFTTELEITVPDTLTTLSNGLLTKQIKLKNGLRTDYWKMNKPIQAYVVMMAIGKFSVIKDVWERKEVSYYVEPQFATLARRMFANTAEMMAFFSKATGVSYPWPKYSQVVVRDYVSGAMENTSATLFGEFMNQNGRELNDRFHDPERNNEDVISHELFHQWFGDYVTCESWSNITVNESFANYGEQLWRRYKYGKNNADELAWKDLQGYLRTSRFKDPQLVRFKYDSREEVFDAISYSKGGSILRYLNGLTGDAAFNKAMKIYLSKNALQGAEAHNWRMAVEEATGQDWNWFFNEWYYHAGHPTLRVATRYSDSAATLMVTIDQENEDSNFLYQLPLKAYVIYGNRKELVDWDIRKKHAVYEYAYRDGVRPVIVPDAERLLPGEIKENRSPAQWLTQYMACTDHINRLLAVNAAGRLVSDSSSQVLLSLALVDSLPAISIAALGQVQQLASDRYRNKWRNTVQVLTASIHTGVRAAAIHVLAAWKDSVSYPLLIAALQDSSYFVSGYALEGISKMKSDTACTIARQMAMGDQRGYLETHIYSILGKNGAESDFYVFSQKAYQVSAKRKVALMLGLSSYIKNVKVDSIYTKAVDLFIQLVQYEEHKNSRRSYAGYIFDIADNCSETMKGENKDDAALAANRFSYLRKAIRAYLDAETAKDLKEQFERTYSKTFTSKD